MSNDAIRDDAGHPLAAFVEAVTAQAGLVVPSDRVQGLAAAAAPVHASLRALAAVRLDDIAPATSFDPAWD
ncbi:hypothetical protein C4K88_13650 [Arthrobacter pityocampae]|uniref:Uncharacterized protein n=2 Tax=Arthrobacter pityocampae TaxID=547334 RepID=A0A2S5IW29_9MICC|nr:hypothetical protein C4K88_13650 [Arthrobacter pityocampae]